MTFETFAHALAVLAVAHCAFALFAYAIAPAPLLKEQYAKAMARDEWASQRLTWLVRAALLAYATWRLW